VSSSHSSKNGERLVSSTRRELCRRGGFAVLWTTLAAWAICALRFFFPRVLFEPSAVFKASFPHEYAVGSVSTRYQQKHKVWIVREEQGFYALLAECTHLGCTPVWLSREQRFKCPCHGSGFSRQGVNYEGPAPRPLERLKISIADDGQLLIDKSVRYRFERGEWQQRGALLKV
jgi:cytochrome b6-f complex iron-sulfur subunit